MTRPIYGRVHVSVTDSDIWKHHVQSRNDITCIHMVPYSEYCKIIFGTATGHVVVYTYTVGSLVYKRRYYSVSSPSSMIATTVSCINTIGGFYIVCGTVTGQVHVWDETHGRSARIMNVYSKNSISHICCCRTNTIISAAGQRVYRLRVTEEHIALINEWRYDSHVVCLSSSTENDETVLLYIGLKDGVIYVSTVVGVTYQRIVSKNASIVSDIHAINSGIYVVRVDNTIGYYSRLSTVTRPELIQVSGLIACAFDGNNGEWLYLIRDSADDGAAEAYRQSISSSQTTRLPIRLIINDVTTIAYRRWGLAVWIMVYSRTIGYSLYRLTIGKGDQIGVGSPNAFAVSSITQP